MRTRLLAFAVAAVAFAVPARALALDTVWQNDNNATSSGVPHRLKGLAAPAGLADALRLEDLALGSCVIQSNGTGLGSGPPYFSCAPDLAVDGTSVDILSSTLRRLALVGAITSATGSPTTAFGAAAGLSLLGVTGSSSGVPAFFAATANNQVAQMLAGVLQFHTLDFSQLTGTPPAITSLTGAVVGTGPGVTATTFGAGTARSLLGVTGSSTARADIACSGDGNVFWDNAGTLGCTALPYSKLGSPPAAITQITGDLAAGPGPGSVTGTITANAVTFPKLQTVTGLSIVGVPGSSTANVSAITAISNNQVMQMFSGGLQFRALDYSQLTGTPVPLVATWSTTGVRVFVIDPSGIDTNQCWADSADQTQANVAVAVAAAHSTPCATLAGAAAEGPSVGAGRTVYVVPLGGNTTYSATGDSWAVFDRWKGYSVKAIVPTSTNSTAGATAFSWTTADLTYQGARTCVGMNAAGYHPTTNATATSMTLALAGGGSPSFAAEPAKPLYCRLRGDAGTTTTADRNAVFSVVQVNGTTTITLDRSLTFATSDTFYLEEAGALAPGGTFSADTGTLVLSGIQATSTVTLRGGLSATMSNVVGTNITIASGASVSISSSLFLSPTTIVGPELFTGNASASGASLITGRGAIGIYGAFSDINPVVLSWLDNDVVGGSVTLSGGGGNVASASPATFGGTTGTSTAARVLGTLTLQTATVGLGFINLPNSTSAYGVSIQRMSNVHIGGVISGGTKTDAGFDFSDSDGSRINFYVGIAPTITGTNGDGYWGLSGTANVAQGIYTSWAGCFYSDTGQRASAKMFPNGTVIEVGFVVNASGAHSGEPKLLTAVQNLGSGSTLSPGTIVRSVNTDGIGVVPAFADSTSDLSGTICILVDAIPNLQSGFALCGGQAVALHDTTDTACHFLTSGGQEVYVSSVQTGTWTCTRPAIARTLGWTVGEQTIQLVPENDLQPISRLSVGGSAQNTEPGLNLIFPSGTPTVTDNPGASRTDITLPSYALIATTVPTTRTLTMTAPMTCDSASSCDLSANRTIATPVFAGSTAGLAPPSSGGTTTFLRADGAYAVPPGTAGSAITSLTGPVTGTGPGAAATTVNLGAGGVTGLLPIADLSTGSAGQIVTMSGGIPQWVTPAAGTVYTGLSPIVVLGSIISCPTCNTATLAAIATSGSASDLIAGTVPAARLGSFTNGSALFWNGGLAQDNAGFFYDVADHFLGLGNTTPSYPLDILQTANGPTGARATNLSTGASAYSQFLASNDAGELGYFGVAGTHYSGFGPFNGGSAYVGSYSTQLSVFTQLANPIVFYTNSTPVGQWTVGGAFQVGNLSAGGLTKAAVTTGQLGIASAADVAAAITWPASPRVVISGGISATPVGDSTFTFDTSTHTLSTFKLNVASTTAVGDLTVNGAMSLPLYGSGTGGIATIDGAGNLQVTSAMAAGTLIWDGAGSISTRSEPVAVINYAINSALNSASGELLTSSTSLQAVSLAEYPIGFLATTATLSLNLEVNSIPALGTLSCTLTRSGSLVAGGPFLTFGSSSTIAVHVATLSTGSSSANDTYGLYCTSTVGGGSVAFTARLAFQ